MGRFFVTRLVGRWSLCGVNFPDFLFCGGQAFLLGVLAEMRVLLWCFCGQFVVLCVVNVVLWRPLFRARKIRQLFEVYFSSLPHVLPDGPPARRAAISWLFSFYCC